MLVAISSDPFCLKMETRVRVPAVYTYKCAQRCAVYAAIVINDVAYLIQTPPPLIDSPLGSDNKFELKTQWEIFLTLWVRFEKVSLKHLSELHFEKVNAPIMSNGRRLLIGFFSSHWVWKIGARLKNLELISQISFALSFVQVPNYPLFSSNQWAACKVFSSITRGTW